MADFLTLAKQYFEKCPKSKKSKKIEIEKKVKISLIY